MKINRKLATLATTAVIALGSLTVAPSAAAAYEPIAVFANCLEGQTVHMFSWGEATSPGRVAHIASAGSSASWDVGLGRWDRWNNTGVRSATGSLVAPPNRSATLSVQCHGV